MTLLKSAALSLLPGLGLAFLLTLSAGPALGQVPPGSQESTPVDATGDGPFGPLITGAQGRPQSPETTDRSLKTFERRQDKLALTAPPLLFPGSGGILPPQEIPEGLNSLSAQECSACHMGSHGEWAASGHAKAWKSEAYQTALKAAGSPAACVQCHTPLMEQQPQTVTSFVQRDKARPVLEANPAFSPLLQQEGVTCAACHVRGGLIYGTRQLPEGRAPHPVVANPDLTRPEFCGSCHQMAIPGAEASPFYDTYDEWREGPWAKAGVGCVDCHMPYTGNASTVGGSSTRPARHHGLKGGATSAQPLTVTLTPNKASYTPGESAEVKVKVLNTGAGHALPTGAPFRVIRGWLDLGDSKAVELFYLTREMSPEPPHVEIKDLRLQAGASQEVTVTVKVPKGTPAGPLMGSITFEYLPQAGTQGAEDGDTPKATILYTSPWSLNIR